MGLDMYLYAVSKPSEEECRALMGRKMSNIWDLPKGFMTIEKERFDNEDTAYLYRELLPFVDYIEVVADVFDQDSCWKEHGIESSDDICGMFMNDKNICWTTTDGRKVSIDEEEYNLYVYESNIEMCLIKCSQLAYWRGEYDLHEVIEAIRLKQKATEHANGSLPILLPEMIKSSSISNCGYYQLSMNERKELWVLLKAHPELRPNNMIEDILKNENLNLFYRAWW